jgi:hypothetical protein
MFAVGRSLSPPLDAGVAGLIVVAANSAVEAVAG